MIDKDGFRAWLEENTEHSSKAVSDVVSRMGRADSLVPWEDAKAETYLFYLEQDRQFSALTISVKSQLRRSARLYKKYIESLV